MSDVWFRWNHVLRPPHPCVVFLKVPSSCRALQASRNAGDVEEEPRSLTCPGQANIFARRENIRDAEAAISMLKTITTLALTRRESQIMEVLYRRRRATVEEIRGELPSAPGASSVRKLLEIMIDRGLLAREYDGPRHVYFPAVHPDEASRSALKQLVRTFFDNSPGSAIAALLDNDATRLSDVEYRRLSDLLKRARRQERE
jgi:BlaI family transcriptional regulator, penicillinase repressor